MDDDDFAYGPRTVPRRTIRLRLTALYGSVFLASSAALLTLTYFVVRHTLRTRHPSRKALERLHLHPGYEYGFRPGSHNARLLHALSQNINNQALARLLAEYIVSLFLITALGALIGWWLAGRSLRPLRQITAAARRVSGENLGERIDLQGPDDELKELATTPSPASATSSPMPPTSCAPRWRSCAPRSTSPSGTRVRAPASCGRWARPSGTPWIAVRSSSPACWSSPAARGCSHPGPRGRRRSRCA
jgi:HAMP domain-containing protein